MIGSHNDVPDRPGWYYGLFIRHEDGTRDFTVYGPDGAQVELERVPWEERHARAQEAIDAAS